MVVISHDDVTRVVEIRERAAEGERAFASLSLASPVGVFRTDASGRVVYVNQQSCEMSGLSEHEVLGDGWVQALHPEDLTRVTIAWADAVHRRVPLEDEYRFMRPDGGVRWVLCHSVPIPGSDGGVAGHMGTLTDITERKQVELAMRVLSNELVALEGDEYYEIALMRLAELAQVEICFFTRFADERATERRTTVLIEDGVRVPNVGYSVAATPCADVVNGQGLIIADGVRALYPGAGHLARWNARSYAGESLLDPAGRALGQIVLIGRRPFSDPLGVGTILRLFGVALSAALVRERDRRRYEDLFEFAPSGLVISDREGQIVMVNRRAEELFGWSAAELTGESIEVLVPPGTRGQHRGKREEYQLHSERRSMASGRRQLMSMRKDGTRFPVEIELAPVETEAGQMIAASVRDVTDRIETEAALEGARRNLVETIESTGQAMVLYDLNDRIAVFNQQLLSMYPGMADLVTEGTSFETMLREAVRRGLLPAQPGEEAAFIAERLAAHRRADGSEIVRTLPDGRVVSFVDRRSRDGGVISVGTDITEQLEQQQKIREMQKMDALGKLTGGMAHDFNNYLGVIIGNLDLLQETLGNNSAAAELVETARGGALQAAELTRSLLAFARRQPLDIHLTELPEHIASVCTLLTRSLGEDISLVVDVVADLWQVKVDPAQLESALVNLANNARDAMPRGGDLRISARNVPSEEMRVEAISESVTGDYVLIEVSDSGTGMTPDVMAHVFEPFFTTKGLGHGTGLGLSMVYGFVMQSGGVMRVHSVLGKGTVMRMFLPRAEPETAAARRSPERGTVGTPGGDETILLVEDNAAIRLTAKAQLASLGYRVIEAENGPAALRVLEERGDEIDLLITDMVMPGHPDGHELALFVESRFESIRVLLTSGFPGDAWNGSATGRKRLPLLGKPYRKTELARITRQVLDAPDPLT